MSILNGEIKPQLQLITISGNKNDKLIHKGSLSFFISRTINTRDQILNLILSLEKDNNTLVELYNTLYKLTFYSNSDISSVLNLRYENKWDANIS